MRVDVILADAAQSIDGKVSLLGGGWSTMSGAAPIAVVIFIEVPWDETNVKKRWKLELLDADGQPVEVPGPVAPQVFSIFGEIEAGRPAGLARGTPVSLPPLAINISPLPLAPGRYEFRVTVDDATELTWSRSFTVN